MKLMTQEQKKKLLQQGQANMVCAGSFDFKPVLKLFTPDANATWLITEIDPNDHDQAFGLCDLGYPELGWVSLSELAAVRGGFGLPIERDLHFTAEYPISVYAEAARHAGTIVTDDRRLREAQAALEERAKQSAAG